MQHTGRILCNAQFCNTSQQTHPLSATALRWFKRQHDFHTHTHPLSDFCKRFLSRWSLNLGSWYTKRWQTHRICTRDDGYNKEEAFHGRFESSKKFRESARHSNVVNLLHFVRESPKPAEDKAVVVLTIDFIFSFLCHKLGIPNATYRILQ